MKGYRFHYLKSKRGAKTPDFLVEQENESLVIEIGGKGKGREQFKGIKGEKKPLSLLGFIAQHGMWALILSKESTPSVPGFDLFPEGICEAYYFSVFWNNGVMLKTKQKNIIIFCFHFNTHPLTAGSSTVFQYSNTPVFYFQA